MPAERAVAVDVYPLHHPRHACTRARNDVDNHARACTRARAHTWILTHAPQEPVKRAQPQRLVRTCVCV